MPVEHAIGTYQPGPPAFHEYDPRCAAVARQVADLIEPHLPGAIVEHIGSTAIPGCGGKGILDLMMLYPPGQLAAARDLLDALGFQHQPSRDPFPESRPMRVGSFLHDGDTFNLHVHVLAADSPEVRELRIFRDRLRADPALLASYVAAKKAIVADGCTDPIEYNVRKDAFVDEAWRQFGAAYQRTVGNMHLPPKGTV